MVQIRDASPTVWTELELLLHTYGFQSYPIPDTEDSDSEYTSENLRPRTIIQLVRGAVGVAPSHAGRSTDGFWNSTEMAKTLQKLWDILEKALNIVQPQQHSLVAWCFSPQGRTVQDIRSVIEEAKNQLPAFPAQRFMIRPLSPGITGVKTPETALINLIGIVKVFENLSYGDLLSEILRRPQRNSVLLSELEKRIPRTNWRNADCDRESPIPQLLVRQYAAYLEGDFSADRNSSLVSFLEELEDQNNLAGLSDRALAVRLVGDPTAGPLPAQIKKLYERHQSN
jgi:hypothetical protein